MQNAPFGISLLFTPICSLYGVLSAPFISSAGPVFLYNFWITVSAVLTALGAALIAMEFGGAQLGAEVGHALAKLVSVTWVSSLMSECQGFVLTGCGTTCASRT